MNLRKITPALLVTWISETKFDKPGWDHKDVWAVLSDDDKIAFLDWVEKLSPVDEEDKG